MSSDDIVKRLRKDEKDIRLLRWAKIWLTGVVSIALVVCSVVAGVVPTALVLLQVLLLICGIVAWVVTVWAIGLLIFELFDRWDQ